MANGKKDGMNAGNFRTPVQIFSLVFGIVYVLVGLGGFLVTGFRGFAEPTGETLIVFGLNPLHNIIHIVIGGLWIASSRNESSAQIVSLTLGFALGLVAVLGFIGALRFLAIESLADPDSFLHLATAAVALYFGSVGAQPARAQRP